MSTETIEIFNNSDEWANQLKHALSKGENLALLHGLTPDILDRIYAYAFDYHEKGNITDAEIYYKFLCIYAFENHEYLKDFASVCQPKKKYQQAYDLYKLSYNYSPYDDYSVIYRMGQCQIGAKISITQCNVSITLLTIVRMIVLRVKRRHILNS
ncbi:type III secretion-associated chaperone [Escherichia coli]|nr:type III secretion-associated chaperone [Escherichia coli]